ncbi:MAG: glycosyltransferase family 4 protein [Rhizobiaceae bacterium]
MAKVVVFGSYPDSLINFRGAMLEAMVKAGHDVHAFSPPAEPKIVANLRAMGVTHHAVSLDRTGLNPLRDFSSLLTLVRMLRKLQPDCLLAYTIKPVVYGGLAARLASVRFFAMITGLGYVFSGAGFKGKILSSVVGFLYRLGLLRAEHVLFQNQDNLRFFQNRGLLSNPQQAVLINGSGVDLHYFSMKPLPKAPNFLMIARLLHDKGVVEYIDAARQVCKQYPQTKFRLAGWIDDNPAAISQSELDGWIDEGTIEYLGNLDDVRPALADCAIYVLPSHHEGLPRTVIEAMSVGRPIVTTDAPGCRDTVTEGQNGFLVPVKNSNALANAMMQFLDKPELISSMAKSSREMAEERFDVHKVNQVILKTMGLI